MTNGEGFMGFWADIDPEYVLRYQEWHNCEHMPERVGIAGFREGRRYRDTRPGTAFFMCYVTDGTGVLGSEAYLAALNRPTPWTREALTHFRNPTRSIFRRLAEQRLAPVHAPYRYLIRFDDPRKGAEIAAALADALGQSAHRSQIAATSLFELDFDASNIMTAERAIYAGGPGAQRYLISIDTALRTTAEALEDEIRKLGLLRQSGSVQSGVYWLEMKVPEADLPGKTQALA